MQQSQQQQFQFYASRHSCQQYHGSTCLPTDKKYYSLKITIIGFNSELMPLANLGFLSESLEHGKTSRDWRNLGRNCMNKKKIKSHTLSFYSLYSFCDMA